MRFIALAILLAGGGCAAVPEGGGGDLPARAASGETLTFRVERKRSSHCHTPEFRTSEEARIEYRVRVLERRGPRDFSLQVNVGSFAIEYVDDHERWEFDSARPEEEDGDHPAWAWVRGLIHGGMSVEVVQGRVAAMRGFPPIPFLGSAGDVEFKERTRLLSQRGVAGDLSLILATDMRRPGVPHLRLSHRRSAGSETGETDGDEPAEAWMPLGEVPLSFTWVIDEDYQGEHASRYSIHGVPPDWWEDHERRTLSVDGDAFVSKADGFLLRLELGSSERQIGGGVTLDRSGSTVITRARDDDRGLRV